MKRICAWCQCELETMTASTERESVITHGICDGCAKRLETDPAEKVQSFLDRLEVPVLMIESGPRVWAANKSASHILGKELPEFEGRPPGDAIECVNAQKPGGCGQQVHCRSCAIRHTVLETFATGKSFKKVLAYPDIQRSGQKKSLCIEISTEKVAGVVFLRIDNIRESGHRPDSID